MKVKIAFNLDKTRQISFQNEFPKTNKCCYCNGNSRLGFVAYEQYKEDKNVLCDLYQNMEDNKLWLHDLTAVAVYFCEECLKPTALYNQA